MTTSAGNVYLITAPSGAGKSSLVNALLARDAGLALSISYTTRAPRPGETDGEHYHFVSEAQFFEMRDQDAFLEWAQVHDHFYGTPKKPLADALEFGRDMILEIDWQGARQVRQLLPDVVGVFILPPSLEALEDRLRNRGQDSEAVIARRMQNAGEEILHAPEFEFVVINQEFDVALQQLQAIVQSRRLRYARQSLLHRTLFESFKIR